MIKGEVKGLMKREDGREGITWVWTLVGGCSEGGGPPESLCAGQTGGTLPGPVWQDRQCLGWSLA